MSLPWIVVFSAAITVVLTQGKLFAPLRERGPRIWRDLANCPLCTGVWMGCGFHLAVYNFSADLREPRALVAGALWLLGTGALAGCSATLFVAVWDWLEAAAHGPRTVTVKDVAEVERRLAESIKDKESKQ